MKIIHVSNKFRITYDEEVEALYVYRRIPQSPVNTKTVNNSPLVNLDFDEDGLTGVEIL